MGAPMSAVTELIGNAPSNPGMRAIRLHNKASDEPVSITAGISMRWSDVLKIVLHKCGTARPKKTMGPQ